MTVNSVADTANPNDAFLTLREAIQIVNGNLAIGKVNADVVKTQIDTSNNPLGTNDVIKFNIGDGAQTIAVTGSALDTVTKTVTIDGTAPSNHADQVIVLDGTSFQEANMKNVNGLTLSASKSEVDNLTIQNFTGYGVQINAPKGAKNGVTKDILAGNTISGNSAYGVWINGSADNSIGLYDDFVEGVIGNVISSNKSGGIRITGANDDHNMIQGNDVINNTGTGIFLDGSANATTIGTDGTTDTEDLGNTIAGNTGDGIKLSSSNNVVGGNYIGIQPSTTFIAGLNNGNTGNGISVYGTGNTIGGVAAVSRNIISANVKNGIYISTVL